MENELISIIVPVYNIIDYLKDCLDSLVKQTYQNIEILLVDNGSTDGSLELCKKYSDQFSTIRLLHEEEKSPGTARNKGLSEMKGSFYSFVDGDDYVSENYIQKLYEAITLYSADLSLCGVVSMLECRDVKTNVNHKTIKTDKEKDLRKSVWGKLYRSDIYKQVRFNNNRMGSDAIYSSDIYKISTNAVICGYCLYAYRSYQESVTRVIPNKAFFKKIDLFIKNNDEKEFQKIVLKCIQVVSHRHEEQLYHTELIMLREKIISTQNFCINNDLMKKLDDLIRESGVSIVKKLYLKTKNVYTSCVANHRRKINYHYPLD